MLKKGKFQAFFLFLQVEDKKVTHYKRYEEVKVSKYLSLLSVSLLLLKLPPLGTVCIFLLTCAMSKLRGTVGVICISDAIFRSQSLKHIGAQAQCFAGEVAIAKGCDDVGVDVYVAGLGESLGPGCFQGRQVIGRSERN